MKHGNVTNKILLIALFIVFIMLLICHNQSNAQTLTGMKNQQSFIYLQFVLGIIAIITIIYNLMRVFFKDKRDIAENKENIQKIRDCQEKYNEKIHHIEIQFAAILENVKNMNHQLNKIEKLIINGIKA